MRSQRNIGVSVTYHVTSMLRSILGILSYRE